MKVAVIIPCHNVGSYVEAAIRSALASSHSDLDILAVDDGSTDGTRSVLDRLKQENPGRFRWIAQQNRGACAARNAGVSATQGGYIQFLDADDVLFPGKIERQLALASDHDLVIGAYRNVFPEGRPDQDVLPIADDAWEALIRARMGTTSANLFRRDALVRAGGWDERLKSSQDYELMFRMMANGASVTFDPHVGCAILKRSSGSITRTDERGNWLRYLELRRAVRDHLRTTDAPANAKRIAVADQSLFVGIRVLSKHDREAAFAEFDRTFDQAFLPERNEANSAAYVTAYRLLGFRMAERIAGMRRI